MSKLSAYVYYLWRRLKQDEEPLVIHRSDLFYKSDEQYQRDLTEQLQRQATQKQRETDEAELARLQIEQMKRDIEKLKKGRGKGGQT